MKNKIDIIKPDDWHVHLREGNILNIVSKFSSRINNRCIVMPNLNPPITSTHMAKKYIGEILESINFKSFLPLIPCYLTDELDLNDFKQGLINNIFIGAKLYPLNATTNSKYGVSDIEKIFPALEILEDLNKNLLIHGEKVSGKIDLSEREKYFIDDELITIKKYFPNLNIVLEHVSTKYGADFVSENKNIAGTITPHHMLITSKDVYKNNAINPHLFCMPVAKEEKDLIALRKYACSGNAKFFLGTDSAPHVVEDKDPSKTIKPGIFSAPCSIELYAEIFEEENSLENLEKFSSINGPKFYSLPINKDKITLFRQSWKLKEFTISDENRIKNFYGDKELKWKVVLQDQLKENIR